MVGEMVRSPLMEKKGEFSARIAKTLIFGTFLNHKP
jgi:hypothetical protein